MTKHFDEYSEKLDNQDDNDTKLMRPDCLQVGDTVADSPVGPGVITGITEAGYPQVNHVAVARLKRTDGVVFDPYGSYKKELLK